MRIFTLLYLAFNHRMFIRKRAFTKELSLLAGVLLLDVFTWLNPDLLFDHFGRNTTKGIVAGIILLEWMLFSICYLKSWAQRYINHYLFLALLLLAVLSSIGYGFTHNQYMLFATILGMAGAGLFGLMNLRYKQPE